RHALLRYFGDEPAFGAACGNCDTCLNPVTTWDASTAVQKLLSCIYRTGQRFGANHVLDVLLGKQTDKVRQFQHDQLSTFGIGQDLDATQWRSVVRQLVARGYIRVDLDGFGSLQLTEQCRPILRGEQPIDLRQDSKDARVKKSRGQSSLSQTIAPHEEPLWEALRACRKRLADEQGVPPYVIFHDSTLLAILRERPLSEAELLQISGVGQRKQERYGEPFLAVVSDFVQAKSATGY